MIEAKGDTVTHLLGYLKPEQWVDALKVGLNKDELWELIKEQDRSYGTNMEQEVKEMIKDD